MTFLEISKLDKGQREVSFDKNSSDLLKFGACIMVALSHFSGYAIASLGSTSLIYRAIAAVFGYLGVAIFFFFSGYGLTISDNLIHLPFKSFFSKRLKKTYLPAVLVSLAWLTTNIIIFSPDFTNQNLLSNQKYFLGVLWLFNDEVMWFVKTIVVLYLFYYIFAYFSRRIAQTECLVLLLLEAVIATLLVKFAHIGDALSVPLFFIGIVTAKWPKGITPFLSWKGVLIFSFLMLIWAILGHFSNRVLHGMINYYLLFLLLFLFGYYRIRLAGLPNWVKNTSYDIYLVHNKAHLINVYLFGIDQLWSFSLMTGLFVFIFHCLRKVCKL